jgi:hypothetical protein
MEAIKKPLWQCPKCHQRFVTRNMSHSCGEHRIDDHFRGKDTSVRHLFDSLLAATRRFGELHVYAQKTRIVFQNRGRFVSVTPRRHFLAGHIWLKRRRAHPTIYRIESLLDKDFVHNFRIHDDGEIDDAFCDLLEEGYAVGNQEF